VICKTCKQDFPESGFYVYLSHHKYVPRSDCKECYRAMRAKRNERKQAKREEKRTAVVLTEPQPFLMHALWRKVATCDGVRYISKGQTDGINA